MCIWQRHVFMEQQDHKRNKLKRIISSIQKRFSSDSSSASNTNTNTVTTVNTTNSVFSSFIKRLSRRRKNNNEIKKSLGCKVIDKILLDIRVPLPIDIVKNKRREYNISMLTGL